MPKAAEAAQKALVAAHPERLDSRLELAELLSNRGDHFAAAALLAEAPEAQQRSPELRRRRAIELYLDGDLQTSAGLAQGLHDEFPDNATVLVLLATIDQADGQWASVLDLIGGLAERNPLNDQLSVPSSSRPRTSGTDRRRSAGARRAARMRSKSAGRTQEATLVAASSALFAARNDREAVAVEIARQLLKADPPVETEIAIDLRLLVADIEFHRAGLSAAMEALGDSDDADAGRQALRARRQRP